jgi:hypothetical protein
MFQGKSQAMAQDNPYTGAYDLYEQYSSNENSKDKPRVGVDISLLSGKGGDEHLNILSSFVAIDEC